MRRNTRILALAALLAGLAGASDARAWDHHHHRGIDGVSSYTVLKAGGYGLDSIDPNDDLDSGWFVGAEIGVVPSPFVELGFSMDWFRRHDDAGDVFIIDSPYGVPIEGRIDTNGTSTDLVPLGGIVRLRYPVSHGVMPFIAGQLTWDILRLGHRELTYVGSEPVITEHSDYFYGPGASLSIGVEVMVDSHVGFLLEAGGHTSEPSKNLVVNGVPVRGHVIADGDFARLGLRLTFP